VGFKSPSAAGAQHLPSSKIVGTSYRVLVSVQGGLHRGAAFIASSSESVQLGSSADCDLVLMDAGVPEKALRLYEQDGALAADVLTPGVRLADATLPLGIKVFSEPMVRLRMGGAVLRVELLRRTHRSSSVVSAPTLHPGISGAAPKRQNWAAFTLAGLIVATALAAVGGAVNASAKRVVQQDARTLNSVVESFNALGAQLLVSDSSGGIPKLSGLVVDAPMKNRLESDIRAAGIKVDMQLHDIRQMAESLTRLALLTGHPCEAKHLGAGRFECDAGVADPAAVSQLRALAQQVPGVVVLNVQARAPEPVLAQAPLAPPPLVPQATEPVRPKLPVIRHVAVGDKGSFAYDGNGRRLRMGDSIDGAKVVAIRFEGVEFLRDKQRYHVSVTPMLTSAPSAPVN
jgi:hypothetical protein